MLRKPERECRAVPGAMGWALDRDVAAQESRDAAADRQANSCAMLRLGIEPGELLKGQLLL